MVFISIYVAYKTWLYQYTNLINNNFNIILFYIAWANYGWRCRQKLIIECVNEFKKVQKQGATNIYYLASHYHQCPMQLNLSSDENGQWNLMAQKKTLLSPRGSWHRYIIGNLLSKIRCRIGHSFARSLCYVFNVNAFNIHWIEITFGHFASDSRCRPRDLRGKARAKK